MPSATASGFPYPVGSDSLADTDLFIKQLADFLEARAGNVPWINVGGGGGAPAFSGSWVNFGAPYQVTQFRKVGDRVELRGAIKSGVSATTVFTLPVGYRPPSDLPYIVMQAAAAAGAYMDILTTGVVRVTGSGVATVTAFELSFSVTA